jgi:hypothetical protein
VQTGLLSRLMGRPAEVKTLPVTLRYAATGLRWELAKGAVGTAGGIGILFGLSPSPWVGVPVAIGTALFAAYGWQQVRRGRIEFEVTEERIAVRPAKAGAGNDATTQAIPWGTLEKFRLKFFAFGRRAEQGTLVLYVEGGGRKIKLDSATDHFATALFYGAQMARTRELTLDPTTLANLEQLGL